MRFKCLANGDELVVISERVGGYTIVEIFRGLEFDSAKTTFQIFEIDSPDFPLHSSEEFLLRAARVALARYVKNDYGTDPIKVFAYDKATEEFTGKIETI